MVLAHNFDDGQRTQDVKISQNITFETMFLAPDTLEGLKNSGFHKPSPIQLHGIPLGKCGFDLLLEAKSGTGKTAVFSVIALEKLNFEVGLQVIILAPTREIAAQICDVIKQIGASHKDLKIEVVMGGLPLKEDIAKFKKNNVQIVVGSPGRLRHMIQGNHIDISVVRLLILDEADKLMEKAFLPDINYIFSISPKEKQVIMSSATYPQSTKDFISRYVQGAQHVCPDSTSILLGIEQKVTCVKYNTNVVNQTKYKFDELLKIFSKKQFKQCLIFCNYHARVINLHKMLAIEKWPSEQLYGQQEQTDRLDALKTLQEYKCRILISTDLAARGIDASNVDLVINFETPFEWQTYLHRIGRAGRFGAYGMAITIVSEGKEEERFKTILESISVKWTNLWKDENNANCTTEEQNEPLQPSPKTEKTLETGENNEIHKKLWSLLTCDQLQKKEENESFDQLCKSFDESKVTNTDDTNDKYRNLPIPFNGVEDTADNHHKRKSKQNNTDNHKKDSPNVRTSLEYSPNPLKSEICAENSTISRKPIEIEESSKSTCYEANSDCLTNCLKIKESDGEDLILSKALLSAGLPTSFGSSKQTFSKPKSKKNQKRKSQVEDNSKDKEKNKQENNAYEQTFHIKENFDFRSNNIKSEIDNVNKDFGQSKYSDGNERQSQAFNKSQAYTSKSKESKHADRVNEIKEKYSRLNQYNSQNVSQKVYQECSRNLSQNYADWYHQLKLRVKQIEMAVYINEISKI